MPAIFTDWQNDWVSSSRSPYTLENLLNRTPISEYIALFSDNVIHSEIDR